MTLDRIARALGTDLVIDFEPQAGNSLSRGSRIVTARVPNPMH